MKVIAGWIDAGDELGLEAGLVERLVLRVESAIASSWRPNTFTIAWPVCISSTWPLSVPVRSHWAANCFCERVAMSTVTTIDGRHDQQRDDAPAAG